MIELLEARTERSKTYALDNGDCRAISTVEPMHWWDGEQWADIALAPHRNVNGRWVVNQAPYDLEVIDGRIGVIYRSKRGGTVTAQLTHVDGHPAPPAEDPTCDDGVIRWQLDPTCDITLVLRGHEVEFFKNLHHADHPRFLTWRIDRDADTKPSIAKTLDPDTTVEAWDADGDRVHVSKAVEQLGPDSWSVTETFGVAAKIVDRKTRRRRSLEPNLPVIVDMPVITEDQSVDADDARLSRWYSYNSDLTTIASSSSSFDPTARASVRFGVFESITTSSFFSKSFSDTGIRFPTVPVPHGATINSADLQLRFKWNKAGPQIRVFASLMANAPQFTASDLPLPTSMANKAATPSTTTLPTFTGGNNDHPIDITDQVQQLVNLDDWSVDGPARFSVNSMYDDRADLPWLVSPITAPVTTSSYDFQAWSAPGTGGNHPTLIVDYTPAPSANAVEHVGMVPTNDPNAQE